MLRVSRRALAACLVLGVLAAAAYPGGTVLDRTTSGYSFFRNSISDLGMTVADNGRSNRLGAALFVASFGALVLSLAACVLAFLMLHASSRRSRSFASVGAVGGFVVALCLFGAALAPGNQAAALHIWFSRMASAVAPPTLLLFAIAAARDDRVSVRAAVAWAILAVVMCVWYAMRWGPSVTTLAGLTIQVTVQKTVAAVVVCVIALQTYEDGSKRGSQRAEKV
jgi:hypothetical protein